MLGSSPWYTYFAHIDTASLESVISGPQPPEDDFFGEGWVNLVDAEWELPDEETFDFEDNGMDPETDDPTDEGEKPVEGCKLYDVGWMKMGIQSLRVPAYAYLKNPSLWKAAYKRPPEAWVR